MKEKLLLAAAALLGFATACNNEEDQPKVVSMYGVPYNNYKIKGKVTDKAGRPIKGIEVRSNAYRRPGQRRRLRRKDRRHRIHRGRTHGQRRRRLGSRGIRQIGRRHRPRGEGVTLHPTSTSPGTEKRTPPMPKQVWHCARRSLYLQNIGCVSPMPKQVWHCALLSLYLPGGYTR